MKHYSIGEVSKILNIPTYNLRYYEKIGLIKNIKKTEKNNRFYTDNDLNNIKFLLKLKLTGMTLKEMKTYSEFMFQGNRSTPQRKELLEQQLYKLELKMEKLLRIMEYVQKKLKTYKDEV